MARLMDARLMERRTFLLALVGGAAVLASQGPALASGAPPADIRNAADLRAALEMQGRGGGRGGGGGGRGGGGGGRGGGGGGRGGPGRGGGGGPRRGGGFHGGGRGRHRRGWAGPGWGGPGWGPRLRCWINRWGERVCRRVW